MPGFRADFERMRDRPDYRINQSCQCFVCVAVRRENERRIREQEGTTICQDNLLTAGANGTTSSLPLRPTTRDDTF
jgi:hypothetical protein